MPKARAGQDKYALHAHLLVKGLNRNTWVLSRWCVDKKIYCFRWSPCVKSWFHFNPRTSDFVVDALYTELPQFCEVIVCFFDLSFTQLNLRLWIDLLYRSFRLQTLPHLGVLADHIEKPSSQGILKVNAVLFSVYVHITSVEEWAIAEFSNCRTLRCACGARREGRDRFGGVEGGRGGGGIRRTGVQSHTKVWCWPFFFLFFFY